MFKKKKIKSVPLVASATNSIFFLNMKMMFQIIDASILTDCMTRVKRKNTFYIDIKQKLEHLLEIL